MKINREFHIISNFLFKEPDTLIGGSANLMFNNLVKENRNEEITLISRFKYQVPENLLKNFIVVNPTRFVSKIPVIKDINFVIQALYKIRRLLRNDNADQIHIHVGMYEYIPCYLWFIWVFNMRCQVFIYLYCPPRNTLISRLIIKYLDHHSEVKIFSLSLNIASILKYLGVKRKIHEIKPIVRFKNGYQPKGVTFTDRKDFLFVGNLKPDKGLNIFLDALSQIKPDRQITVTILTEEIKISIEDITKNYGVSSLDSRIKLDWIELCDDICSLYESHKFIVFPWQHTYGPSDYPVALLEAMCLGCSPICSSLPGNVELGERYPEIIFYDEGGLVEVLNKSISLRPICCDVMGEKYIDIFME